MKKIIGKSIFYGGTINHQKLAELLHESNVDYDLFEMDNEGTLTLHFDEQFFSTVEKCIAGNDNTIDEINTLEEAQNEFNIKIDYRLSCLELGIK